VVVVVVVVETLVVWALAPAKKTVRTAATTVVCFMDRMGGLLLKMG
jgi:ABC-type transporter Mla subunit MlaD